MPPQFRNEPFTDFSKEENLRAMREALELVKGKLGQICIAKKEGNAIKIDVSSILHGLRKGRLYYACFGF